MKVIRLCSVFFFLLVSTQIYAEGPVSEICEDNCSDVAPYYSYKNKYDCLFRCLNEEDIDFSGIFKELAAQKHVGISKASKVSFKLIAIPKGTKVKMGSETGDPDEKPVRDKKSGEIIPDILTENIEAMATEFTNGQLVALMYGTEWWHGYSDDRCDSNGEDCKKQLLSEDEINKPARYLNWNDANTIASVLTDKDPDYKYRLPYEAEWEYMAQGSDLGTAYYNTSGGPRDVGKSGTANSKGFYDMLGNVWEWVYDSYIDSYSEKTENNRGRGYVERGEGSDRVLRGGSWYNSAHNCRSANRYRLLPDFRHYWINSVGLRFVRTPK